MQIKGPVYLGVNYKRLLLFIFTLCFVLAYVFSLLGTELFFTFIFDLLILSSIVFFKTTRLGLILIFSLTLYLLYHIYFTYFEYGGGAFRDLFLSVKFLIYFVILISVCKRSVIEPEDVSKGIKILFVFFLIKYISAHLMGVSRPPLYTENNFEMCFLSVIYFINVYIGKANRKTFFIFLLIIILSGSRSAILGLLLIYIYQFKPFTGLSIKQILRLCFFSIVGLIALGVIISRMTVDGLEGVDRYVFLLIFLENLSDWGVKEYLIGNSPLTPLSSTSCQQLLYYKDLFSKNLQGVCYPLILHLFWLRVIMEHGFLMIIIIAALTYYVLRTKGIDNRGSLFCIGIVSVNGLSVSAFSSSIVFFSLIIIGLMNLKKST